MLSAVPVAQIVDARCPLADVLSLSENEVRALERDVMGLPSAERADRFDAVLSARLRPSEREACMAIANLVEEVEADASIRSAAALATRAGLGLRTLQRRFKERVGLAPKTVILRFRLIEAAERLVRGDASSSELAAELGYADQSHFVRAFRDLIGETPESYAQANR